MSSCYSIMLRVAGMSIRMLTDPSIQVKSDLDDGAICLSVMFITITHIRTYILEFKKCLGFALL